MTLEEFRATGRAVESLPETACDQGLAEGPGRVYVGGLYIEGTEGGYSVTIGNFSEGGALPDLEVKLFLFALAEGYADEQ